MGVGRGSRCKRGLHGRQHDAAGGDPEAGADGGRTTAATRRRSKHQAREAPRRSHRSAEGAVAAEPTAIIRRCMRASLRARRSSRQAHSHGRLHGWLWFGLRQRLRSGGRGVRRRRTDLRDREGPPNRRRCRRPMSRSECHLYGRARALLRMQVVVSDGLAEGRARWRVSAVPVATSTRDIRLRAH